MMRRRARRTSITISAKNSTSSVASRARMASYVDRQSARYTQETSVNRDSNRHQRSSTSFASTT